MTNKSDIQLEDKIIWLQGLLVECPMGAAEPDCPLQKLRDLPLAERMSLPMNMPIETIDKLIVHHQACLKRREQ